MAKRRSQTTGRKREREREKQEKRRDKAERRVARKEAAKSARDDDAGVEATSNAPGTDPDRGHEGTDTMLAEDPARVGLHWTNLVFLVAAHALALCAVVYVAAVHFSWWTLGLGVVWSICCGLSITGGYHRLFAHSAYRASPVLRAFYLLFGAAAVQNSALAWSADHRAHHASTDERGDPYSIAHGFWWAHVGWIVSRAPRARNRARVRSLERDPLIRLQHVWYVPLAILVGALLPAAIGSLWGDALGALLVAGWLRLVLQWHATFSVNSLAHSIGRRPYSLLTSARDSVWVAFVTLGEGYHNFHHRFQTDYRNGIRWYHFDPTKWWIWVMAKLGLARDLRRIPRARIAAVRSSVWEAHRALAWAPTSPPSFADRGMRDGADA